MRFLFFFLPAMLAAQVSTPKSTASSPKSSVSKAPAAAKPKAATGPALTTDDQKTIYALGLSVYRSLAPFDLSPAELDVLKRALSDAAAGKPALDLNTWGPKIEPLAHARAARVVEEQRATSRAYLEKAAATPGSIRTDSGLIYRELRPGTGPSPRATDTVRVNYRGTLVDGSVFDSSYARNEPAQFPLNGVIRCWTEGLQKMRVGGKAVLVCPAELAYGNDGRPGIPGGATLTFEIELLDIVGAH